MKYTHSSKYSMDTSHKTCCSKHFFFAKHFVTYVQYTVTYAQYTTVQLHMYKASQPRGRAMYSILQ